MLFLYLFVYSKKKKKKALDTFLKELLKPVAVKFYLEREVETNRNLISFWQKPELSRFKERPEEM